MQTNKILEISSLRVIAMFLIVYYHCYTYYFHPVWHTRYPDALIVDEYKNLIWLNSLHLPIFVLISGFLYGYQIFIYKRDNRFQDFIIRKAKRLIIPYVLWGIMLIIIGQGTFMQFFKGEIAHLWFLPMLFTVFLIIGLFKNIIINSSRTWIFCFFPLTILLNLLIPIINIECVFTSSLSYFTYFYAGLCLTLLSKKYTVPKIIFHFAISVFLFVISFLIKIHPFSIIICLRVISIIILSASFLLLLKTMKQKGSSIIEKLNNYSMGIYIIHHIFIWGMLDVPIFRLFMNRHYIIAPILLFFISIILSYATTSQLTKLKYKHLILG